MSPSRLPPHPPLTDLSLTKTRKADSPRKAKAINSIETQEGLNKGDSFFSVLSWLKRNGDYCLIGFCGVFLMTCMIVSLVPPKMETFELTNTVPPDWVSAELSPSQGDWLQPANEQSALANALTDEPLTPRKPSHPRQAKKKTPKSIPIIHMNQASLALWSELPGIGPKTAAKILQYKKTKGNFQTLEDLMNVKGIGPKKFEKIRPYLKL